MTEAHRRIRCAIYTRKSSEEGLEQEFNSLDAQREACEAYIASQRHEGWLTMREGYDDGGYSGGNLDRPGLQNLLEDMLVIAARVPVRLSATAQGFNAVLLGIALAVVTFGSGLLWSHGISVSYAAMAALAMIGLLVAWPWTPAKRLDKCRR